MKIGKIKKVIHRPDVIPVKLPKPKKEGIKVTNWPVKQPQPIPR